MQGCKAAVNEDHRDAFMGFRLANLVCASTTMGIPVGSRPTKELLASTLSILGDSTPSQVR